MRPAKLVSKNYYLYRLQKTTSFQQKKLDYLFFAVTMIVKGRDSFPGKDLFLVERMSIFMIN